MIRRRVYAALKDTLAKFIMNFNEEQLNVGLISGDVEMKNLILNADVVNAILSEQNLPIQLKAGMIGKIKVKVRQFKSLTLFIAFVAQHAL
jgi:hypothetical protein